MDDLETARRWFAEDLRVVAAVGDARVVDAFATVPRERYLGPGPWQLHSRLDLTRIHDTPDADPRYLCHDVLVSIDEASGINNGLPSLWAMVFDDLAIKPGETVLQVGAGVGYYTAILAELVGPSGRVIGYEIETPLADRAAQALVDRPGVEIVAGNAVGAPNLPDLDVVVACAGVTHVPEGWLSRLGSGGRMVLPVTGSRSWGFLMRLDWAEDGWPIRSLGPCGFYPCSGARRDAEAAAWDKALQAAKRPTTGTYRQGPVPSDREPLVSGDGWWIAA